MMTMTTTTTKSCWCLDRSGATAQSPSVQAAAMAARRRAHRGIAQFRRNDSPPTPRRRACRCSRANRIENIRNSPRRSPPPTSKTTTRVKKWMKTRHRLRQSSKFRLHAKRCDPRARKCARLSSFCSTNYYNRRAITNRQDMRFREQLDRADHLISVSKSYTASQ